MAKNFEDWSDGDNRGTDFEDSAETKAPAKPGPKKKDIARKSVGLRLSKTEAARLNNTYREFGVKAYEQFARGKSEFVSFAAEFTRLAQVHMDYDEFMKLKKLTREGLFEAEYEELHGFNALMEYRERRRERRRKVKNEKPTE